MHVLEAIRGRRSIRPELMKPDPVPRGLVEVLLDAANWAPSHGATEPWRFIVFSGPSRLALAEVLIGAETGDEGTATDDPRRLKIFHRLSNAPVTLAIICSPTANPRIPRHEELAAVAMAVQNLHLAARAHGLGGFWSSGKKIDAPCVTKFLGIEPPAFCLGFFFIGWPAIPWPDGSRSPVTHKVTWMNETGTLP